MRLGENRMTAQSSSVVVDLVSPVARMTDPDEVCSQLISGWMVTWSTVAPSVGGGRRVRRVRRRVRVARVTFIVR